MVDNMTFLQLHHILIVNWCDSKIRVPPFDRYMSYIWSHRLIECCLAKLSWLAKHNATQTFMKICLWISYACVGEWVCFILLRWPKRNLDPCTSTLKSENASGRYAKYMYSFSGTYTGVCMYVCMHACMYVCMYVKYVCNILKNHHLKAFNISNSKKSSSFHCT